MWKARPDEKPAPGPTMPAITPSTVASSSAAMPRPIALRPSETVLPSELFGSAVEGFFQERARAMIARAISQRAYGRLAPWAVYFPNIDLIEPQFACGLGNDRFHDYDSLHATG